ncbi:MAG: hypothetical protein JO159_17030 [Acidobacteria bacterium]|nr:hypothetical protein [Acidobacteriota bacterium]
MTETRFRTTSDRVHDDGLRSRLLDELWNRQLPSGGWSECLHSKQAALEPSCLAALVARLNPSARQSVRNFLLKAQNPNGSWPAFIGDDPDGSWVSSLALLALGDHVPASSARLRGFLWLIDCKGRESHWLWRWKFLTSDRHVRFDPHKYGWPWFPETVSWVVPTSFAILACEQFPSTCTRIHDAEKRIESGVDMLIDRACPGGGWNAGNGVVYGQPLAPHVDDTAVALLALKKRKGDLLCERSLDWVEESTRDLRTPWSLSWAILALAAHGRSRARLESRLKATCKAIALLDTCTLALACLALHCPDSLYDLGVQHEC